MASQSLPKQATKDETSYAAQANSNVEDWLSLASQSRRRQTLGFNSAGPLNSFVSTGLEFVCLGTWCGVGRALQGIGCKQRTYPFDWTRTPVDGILHLLDNHFTDFLTYTRIGHHGKEGTIYEGTRWGGSFWHHNPGTPQAKEEFERRIERFYGRRVDEVPPTGKRLFLRAANSTRELSVTFELYDRLNAMLPHAPVYLLVFVELQSVPGPVRVAGYENVIFYRMDETMFQEMEEWSMEKAGEAYAAAIASACKIFTKTSCIRKPKEVPDLETLNAMCDQYDAGSPTHELFHPKKLKTQALSIRSLRQELSPSQCTTSTSSGYAGGGKTVQSGSSTSAAVAAPFPRTDEHRPFCVLPYQDGPRPKQVCSDSLSPLETIESPLQTIQVGSR